MLHIALTGLSRVEGPPFYRLSNISHTHYDATVLPLSKKCKTGIFAMDVTLPHMYMCVYMYVCVWVGVYVHVHVMYMFMYAV